MKRYELFIEETGSNFNYYINKDNLSIRSIPIVGSGCKATEFGDIRYTLSRVVFNKNIAINVDYKHLIDPILKAFATKEEQIFYNKVRWF